MRHMCASASACLGGRHSAHPAKRHLAQATAHCAATVSEYLQLVIVSWKTSYAAVETLLQTTDEKLKDDLTVRWRNSEFSELQFIELTVSCPKTLLTFHRGRSRLVNCLVITAHSLSGDQSRD